MPNSNLFPALRNLSVAHLADLVDVTPRDILDDLIAAGVRSFWHEGQKFRSVDELRTFLARYHLLDPIRELEVDLNATQLEQLAGDWGVSLETLNLPFEETVPNNSPKPLRKFVGSEAQIPATAANRRLG